jgi:anti-anti-sigma factor
VAHLALSAARPDGVTVARVIAPDRRVTTPADYGPDGRPQRLPEDLLRLSRSAPGPVVLDCRGIDVIDSSGVGVILSLWKGLRVLNRPLAVVVPDTIRPIFEVARLTRLFPLATDPAAAARAVLPAGADVTPESPTTPETWLRDPDPYHRLETLPAGVSGRKRRLFAVACGRRIGHLLANDVCRRALAVADAHADGGATNAELEDAHAEAVSVMARAAEQGRLTAPMGAAAEAANPYPAAAAKLAAAWAGEVDGPEPQLALVADVFGNPFRTAQFNPSWLTAEVRRLAWQIDHETDFDLMPALAASLTAAGCDDAELLAHCGELGGHVRGCWAIDVVLGK